MSFRNYLFLFLLGLAVPVFIAQFQPIPGYLDADYYFAGGIQLAQGRGFVEPYLWNYLDGTTSLPHPSHSYWMPLSSMVAALGMLLTGETTYASGRLFFFLIAALVPPLTAKLAFSFSKRRDLAMTSGILAVFCVYNAPFLGVTDNFGIFMLLGATYFLVVTKIMDAALEDKQKPEHPRGALLNWFLLGVLAGLLNLSRTDGLLWLGMTFIFAFLHARSTVDAQAPIANYKLLASRAIYYALPALFGFLLIMSPWYVRNWNLYGTLMAPGGSRALWLASYDQTFIYPPDLLNADYFFALGWRKILADRMSALGTNLLSGFAAHGGILPFPFIVLGVYYYRKDRRVQLAGIAWMLLLVVMSFLFPFAGARGAFFHAGAALQPTWWALAPLGLEFALNALSKRGIGSRYNRRFLRGIMIMVTIMLTAYVVNLRLFVLGWGEGEDKYPAVETFLRETGIADDAVVIVGNAPGYYISTGRSAISIPYGGEPAIRAVARQFRADYVLLEAINSDPKARYEQFLYLGEVNGIRTYQIEP